MIYFPTISTIAYRNHRRSSDVSETHTLKSISSNTTTTTSSSSLSEKFGQTANSIVFKGRRLISKTTTYEVNEPIKNEEIPSYKGFDSFDDIDIGKPDQDFLDSGLYSLTAEAPVTRKSLQPFDFADIGLSVKNRERWSLSPLRKRFVF